MNALPDNIVRDIPFGGPRRGDWFETFTGKQFWPFDPRPGDFDILDIAHHLSQAPRFCGALIEPYSVAQHSVFVASLLPPHLAFQGLMHDAAEAYFADLPRPLKHGLPIIVELEQSIWRVLAPEFGLPVELDPRVKLADNVALVTERRDLKRKTPHRWSDALENLTPYPGTLIPWSAARAEQEFLELFERLLYTKKSLAE